MGQKYELLIPQTRQTHIISQTPPYLLNLTPLVIVSVAKWNLVFENEKEGLLPIVLEQTPTTIFLMSLLLSTKISVGSFTLKDNFSLLSTHPFKKSWQGYITHTGRTRKKAIKSALFFSELSLSKFNLVKQFLHLSISQL